MINKCFNNLLDASSPTSVVPVKSSQGSTPDTGWSIPRSVYRVSSYLVVKWFSRNCIATMSWHSTLLDECNDYNNDWSGYIGTTLTRWLIQFSFANSLFCFLLLANQWLQIIAVVPIYGAATMTTLWSCAHSLDRKATEKLSKIVIFHMLLIKDHLCAHPP